MCVIRPERADPAEPMDGTEPIEPMAPPTVQNVKAAIKMFAWGARQRLDTVAGQEAPTAVSGTSAYDYASQGMNSDRGH